MLETEKREKLFASLKKDDAVAFGEIASSEVFSAVFGRFPLFSLLQPRGDLTIFISA